LHTFKGQFLCPEELAYEAIHVERDILKDHVGCQDQVLAAHGGFNLVEFRTERDIVVNRVPLAPARMAEFESHLILVFTGIKRKASDVVAHQLKRVGQNLRALRSMRAMVYQGHDVLVSGRPLREFGELLHHAWEAKRGLDGGVSNAEIDAIYAAGRGAGAWGGKLLGAGGGGFMLFFAPPEVHPALREVFAGRQILDVKINAPGSQIIFS
jgi:D-glycero-alpha-D-manno-heptose-7-phosphate kinase